MYQDVLVILMPEVLYHVEMLREILMLAEV